MFESEDDKRRQCADARREADQELAKAKAELSALTLLGHDTTEAKAKYERLSLARKHYAQGQL